MNQYIIMIAVSVVLIVTALYLLMKMTRLAKTGIKAEGVVFDLEISDSNSNMGTLGKVRYPVIRFLTSDNKWITETYKLGSTAGLYKKGAKITVIYNPENPREFSIDNRSSRILLVVLACVGAGLLLIGAYQILVSA